MSSKPIDLAVAQKQLARVNAVLTTPVLLIGGMAVQRYCVTRNSKDLDIVCEHTLATEIVRTLYTTDSWTVNEENDDPYRPSYRIRHRTEDLGEIVIGPKILEREAYQFINWSMLERGSRPYKHKDGDLLNIKVPSAAALAFTKLLSFIGRRSNADKSRQDLQDFVDLSNNDEFSLIQFISFIAESKSYNHIRTGVSNLTPVEDELFRKSSIFKSHEIMGIANTPSILEAAPKVSRSESHSMTPVVHEIAKIALKHQGKQFRLAKSRDLLVVVDVQNDFFENGTLAAAETESLLSPLNDLIRRAAAAGIEIVFTRDWHPENHNSFREWGRHCVRDTDGAQLHPNLYKPDNALVIDIGVTNEMDGYSPFEDPQLQALAAGSDVMTIYVVGMALEFCVLATCRDAVWYGKTVVAVEPYIRSATRNPAEREYVLQLLTSIGVIRAQNVAIGSDFRA